MKNLIASIIIVASCWVSALADSISVPMPVNSCHTINYWKSAEKGNLYFSHWNGYAHAALRPLASIFFGYKDGNNIQNRWGNNG